MATNAAQETRLPRGSDYTPEQRALNFVRPFLRQGFRLCSDATGAVWLESPDGSELAPEWETGIARHAPALKGIMERQRAAHGPQNAAQEG